MPKAIDWTKPLRGCFSHNPMGFIGKMPPYPTDFIDRYVVAHNDSVFIVDSVGKTVGDYHLVENVPPPKKVHHSFGMLYRLKGGEHVYQTLCDSKESRDRIAAPNIEVLALFEVDTEYEDA